MDKATLSAEIDHIIAISYKKKDALITFKEAVKQVSELYAMDKREAFSILAIMQSIIVGFTVDSSGDNPTLKDIIAEAEDMLSKNAKRESEGKSE